MSVSFNKILEFVTNLIVEELKTCQKKYLFVLFW